ncbi:carboxypeptidase-like regulatory domain-containing protein [Neolewinella litorea]|nr:carboxypeptidase-like regulatory domain-containing protein [Neolewinella litorea]
MPAPLLAGLGAKGVSELVAIGAIVASTGTTVATLPDAYVTIGSISLSMASAGTIYVGDRFILTGHVEVSYGEVSAGEGSIKVEIIEEGMGVLKTKVIRGQAPKERVTIRLVGQTISHGKKFYYLRATPTGEEDKSWLPTGDTVVTKPATTSSALAIDVQKPLSFSTKLLTASVNHGEQARAIMKVTNHSESKALCGASIASSNDNLGSTWLLPGTSDLRIVDHRGGHPGDDHADEQTFYFEPVQHWFHFHSIRFSGLPFVAYDQLLPAKVKIFDPLPVICKGRQADRRVGYLPGHTFPGVNEGEYAYACHAWNENEEGLPATATLRDDYGNTLTTESGSDGKLILQGGLLGEVATLTIQPQDEYYAAYSLRLLLDQSFLSDSDNAYVFHPRPLPPIEGVVLFPGAGRVLPGTLVQLIDGQDELIQETTTDAEGTFSLPVTAGLFRSGTPHLRTRLPWNLTYDWTDPEPAIELTYASVAVGDRTIVVKATVPPAEDWVTITARAGYKDFASGELVPVGGVEIVVRTETQQVVDSAVSDANGKFSFSVNPGRYILEVVNVEDLGYRAVSSGVVELRSSRSDVNLMLRFPSPELEYVTPSVLWWNGGDMEGDRLLLLAGGEVLQEWEGAEEGRYLDLRELTEAPYRQLAIGRGDHRGPGRILE